MTIKELYEYANTNGVENLRFNMDLSMTMASIIQIILFLLILITISTM
jgi:hypothetical protein